MGPREALDQICTMIKAGLACDDVDRIHALLRDMKLTAEQAISQRGLRRGRVLALTNRSLNTEARSSSSSARSESALRSAQGCHPLRIPQKKTPRRAGRPS
jgi:hypothetical protein